MINRIIVRKTNGGRDGRREGVRRSWKTPRKVGETEGRSVESPVLDLTKSGTSRRTTQGGGMPQKCWRYLSLSRERRS